ncbi:MAG: hypothetical protein MUE48_08925 [Desulfobacterales bacterium]|jgi:hypothetical protein|nr:hypothetical protein [Desulfobacterales bacterium]
MKPHRTALVAILIISLSFAAGAAAAPKETDARARLAAAYGAGQFGQVEELRYTFNVQLPDRTISRAWSWEPKKDRVTFRGTADQGGTVTYDRASLASASEQVKKLDPQFVNDNYWLIFPLRLSWDEAAFVTAYQAPVKLPIGTGEARRLVVKYPDNEGYTPGDVYELFVDKSYRIVQWIYRKGGDRTPTRVTTWEDYRKAGPLTLSLDHKSADGKFRVWFTDVAVRVAGKPDWIPVK